MSFTKADTYPCNPVTVRGESTKLSSSKDKIVYTNGRTVVIRDLKDAARATTYTEHVRNATVARISPSGYYCASADITGTVRIWDTVGEDQVLKGEYKVITGTVKDLEWDGESKRIIAVGDGRDKFGHAFMMDSGSSTGEIIGHSKVINAVSIRRQRPFRAATAADDATIVFHQGTPYKYDKTIKTHTRFVQDVRYAPSGDHFASVGSDAKIFIYDGKTGETLGEFTDDAHSGSITACSWNSDSTSLVTSSADRTVKLWDVEARKAVTTWSIGAAVVDQQVGNAWTEGGDIVSLSLSGELNVFDKRVGDKPARILHGPQKAVTAAVSTGADTFLAGTADGRVLGFADGRYVGLEGEQHSGLITGLAAAPGSGAVYSVGFDDCVREIAGGASFVRGAVCALASQPRAVAAAADGTVFVAELGGVEAVRANQRVAELKPAFAASAVAVAGALVALGGEDQKVHLYDWDGIAFKERAVLEGNKGVVTALAFAPDGALLAAGDSSGKIVLFNVAERKAVTSRWAFHSARIHALAWTADGRHCASGSLDTHAYVWSVQNPIRKVAVKNAGLGGVNAVFWMREGVLATTGADGCVRTWAVDLV